MEPILHLSIPVRDLDESVEFYTGVLGCEVGRVRDSFVDVWFYGMQVTLHAAPEQVLSSELRGMHHFGVTLGADDLEQVLRRATARNVAFASARTTEHAGTPREQTKAKVLDPSGNAIEIKSYADPGAALEHRTDAR